MSKTISGTREELGKKAVRFAVTVVGLLLLRGLLSVLPMLKNATAIGNTLLSPLVAANAVVDTLILVALVTFGFGLSRALRQFYPRVPEVGTASLLAAMLLILVSAYNLFELPVACIVISPQGLFSAKTADAIPQLAEVLRQFAEGISPELLKTATGTGLEGYQKMAVAMLRQPPDIYGWVFLILAAIPLTGIVILVSRNLDRITELLFHKAKAASASGDLSTAPAAESEIRCNNCGQTMAPGTKFCPQCGIISRAMTVAAIARKCSSCGAENANSAKFCKECGHAA